ncbi:DUF2298 domain-containing protein [Candidatus Viridilinea mediisalina]|uniref:YYY membrane protein n=1 Tax=Candidatus Viridilinea mediisalina TaxID=2024553 RepID=A0A2A6RMZ1_9CHLR|nr:DUF2298 domain-containing protein [Candidatus Viridilinea mediisalina]PDW04286.1 hypothetical protein CJ255_04345 [Candidatus Viridilinea mediisalina]
MVADLLIWWLVAQLMGLVGLLPARWLFGALPDQGYAYAKSLGLLLVGYVAWMLAMLGVAPFGRMSLVLTILALLGLALWRARGSLSLVWLRKPRIPFHVFSGELIFLAALLFVVWIRAHDPNPWGTERPMDFAFFNAVQNTGIFPPNDPWLAGFSINYYYFGYVLMGAMALLSGLEAPVAYNLALALIFALTAQGVAGTISNLMRLSQAAVTPMTLEHAALSSTQKPIGTPCSTIDNLQSTIVNGTSRWALMLVSLLGVLIVLVVGNQSGALQVLLGNERAVVLNGAELLAVAPQVARGASELVLPAPILSQDFGQIERLARQDQIQSFNWWWPSRSLWDAYPQDQGLRRYNITEFPLFSFRLGDLHPHVMALPFGLLAMALALQTVVAASDQRGLRGVQVGLIGLVIGSLYVINSWDLPSYLLLYAGALAIAGMRAAPPYPWLAVGRQLFVVGLVAYLLFLPFHLTFRSLVGAAAPLLDWPIVGRLTSIIAPYAAERSGLHAFVIIFGLFAVALVSFVYLVRPTETPSDSDEHPLRELPLGLFWLPLGLLLLGLLFGFPLLALGALGCLAAWRALTLAQQPAASFVLLVITLGCAIIFGTELIFIRDVFGTRMNTIFKFYYQVWLLWGTVAPFALWWMLHHAQTPRARGLAWGSSVATLLLLIGALVYPWLTLSEVGRGRWIGLEGRTPREFSAAGVASVQWLRSMAAPGSVVLEAAAVDNADAVAAGLETPRCGGSYNGEGFGGIAAATGLPTILGWDGHQRQWRGGDPEALAELGPRCIAVDSIYRTLDSNHARTLLERYHVAYIYIGQLEQNRYPPEALAKFSNLGELVFHEEEVRIYRVVEWACGDAGCGDAFR